LDPRPPVSTEAVSAVPPQGAWKGFAWKPFLVRASRLIQGRVFKPFPGSWQRPRCASAARLLRLVRLLFNSRLNVKNTLKIIKQIIKNIENSEHII
jgi:hypothetical protein